MAAEKRKSPRVANVGQSEQKTKDRTLEELRKRYLQARDAMPPEVPKFFNLQIDEWNMNQYGSMMPDVERARRMRQGEWLGLALPHQNYDHEAYMAEIMPEFDEWRLKTMITDRNNQQLADKAEEARLRREVEEHFRVQEVQQKKQAAESAKRAAEATAAAAAKVKERIDMEAELAAVCASPSSPRETPERYRRRVQLRLFRNQIERRRMEAKVSDKPFVSPSLPPSDSDFYQPLPEGIYGSIQITSGHQPLKPHESPIQRRGTADDGKSTLTFSASAMEHHPQPAETHYFNPEASTRQRTEHWDGDPFQTVHPYLGKVNPSGPKYANWSPHPHLCDMDTLQKRFGSWRGSQALEVEPQVNAGNLRGERLRLGWGAEYGNVRYPPVGLCNEQQFVPTEHPGHVCRVDYNSEKYPCLSNCPVGIRLSGTNSSWPITSRPGMPWYSMQGLKPEHGPAPYTLNAEAPAAGFSTECNVSLSYRNHPRNIMDPNLRNIILSKTMGQFVAPQFHPHPGDIMILQRPRCHLTKDRGFVAFYTRDEDSNQHFVPGDQIIRVGKFIEGSWKFKKHFKMFKLIELCRWMIIGLLENDRSFTPIEKPCSHKVATVVLGFWPRRGDLLLKALSVSGTSQLDWVIVPGTGPAFKPKQGDLILRASISRPSYKSGEMAGTVEMYVYDGAGLGWVFMGRDDSLLDSEGRDVCRK